LHFRVSLSQCLSPYPSKPTRQHLKTLSLLPCIDTYVQSFWCPRKKIREKIKTFPTPTHYFVQIHCFSVNHEASLIKILSQPNWVQPIKFLSGETPLSLFQFILTYSFGDVTGQSSWL